LALATALVSPACRAKPADERPLARRLASGAAAWLWSKQAPDGGWHSETYGLLRSGQALTPFVLCALLEAREVAPAPQRGVERALGFLRGALDAEGRLGLRDPDLLEYPNYATAYALRCFLLADPAADRLRVARASAYLVEQQYREENGFPAAHAAHGGWGFGGRHAPGVPGHMDLAHTRRALEALAAAGRAGPPVRDRAQAFLRSLQHDDPSDPAQHGGFWFSPVVLSANKGLRAGERWRAYATATCDGLLALLAAGVDPLDPRVVSARLWLARHPALDAVGGIPADQPTPWSPALFHYHLAVRAEVERALGETPRLRDLAAPLLAARVRPDGSFESDSPLMKEDDPLLATTLALIALR
jgi:hypothetical protein